MILIFTDLNSPLMFNRINILLGFDDNIVLVHNATNNKLSKNIYQKYQNFKIIEQPQISNNTLRYLVSSIFTFYLIIKYKPSLIIIHWASRLYQNITFSLFGSRCIVHTMGGDIDKLQDANGKKHFYTSVLLKKAAVVTVKSEYMKNMLLDSFSIKEKKIQIINWGVEKRFFNIKQVKKPIDQLNFFCIRAMNPFYNKVEVLNSFLNYIKKTGRNDTLYISTYGKSHAYFEHILTILKSHKNIKDKIKFVNINHEMMDQFLKKIDFVISNTKTDGLSQSVMESLCAKKHLIIRGIKNYQEYINENNAIIFKEINSNTFEQAVNEYYSKKFDFSCIEQFNFNFQKEKYIQLLTSMNKKAK